jgi:5,6-dimethylbenzimidazole synthase
MPEAVAHTPPTFDALFQQQFEALLGWRRDVRRFRADPIPREMLVRLCDLAVLAPSVGNSQPWRFVAVDDPARRAAIIADFKRCNSAALGTYSDEQARLYASLKLEGLEIAPIHLAAFCDENVAQGHRLGRLTMPEALSYSVVIAVHTIWLAARLHGLGVGWVSILDPQAVCDILEVPKPWKLIAYLCIGWPAEEHLDPELERSGWQARSPGSTAILQR